MRSARIKEQGAAYYHVVSRIIEKQMVLNRDEKERFRGLLRRVEGFSGVEVLTWCCLTNHFHILLHVPEPEELSDEQVVRRLRFLYTRREAENIGAALEELRQAGEDKAAEALRRRYTCRMYDLSEFVKTLKQRLTQSYNARHERRGTLWEDRFKSVLLQPSRRRSRLSALSAVAAYIDLNAVRAGLVSDPKDYRFSGYGEAVAGDEQARRGLTAVLDARWAEAAREYRALLYLKGEKHGAREAESTAKSGFSPEQVAQVLAKGGELSVPEVLRCRVRYLTDGAVLGSRRFVARASTRHHVRLGVKYPVRAQPMQSAAWAGLCTLRRHRTQPVAIPVVA